MAQKDLLESLTETRNKIQAATKQLTYSFDLAKSIKPQDDTREVQDLKRVQKLYSEENDKFLSALTTSVSRRLQDWRSLINFIRMDITQKPLWETLHQELETRHLFLRSITSEKLTKAQKRQRLENLFFNGLHLYFSQRY